MNRNWKLLAALATIMGGTAIGLTVPEIEALSAATSNFMNEKSPPLPPDVRNDRVFDSRQMERVGNKRLGGVVVQAPGPLFRDPLQVKWLDFNYQFAYLPSLAEINSGYYDSRK